jgi:periplasmic protein TonB
MIPVTRKLAGVVAAAGVAIAAFAPTLAVADPAWNSKVARIIADNQTYPRSAQLRGDEGTVKVRVTVDASGKVTSTQVVEPSSSDILNREAEKIFQKVNLPAPGADRTLVVPLTWKRS